MYRSNAIRHSVLMGLMFVVGVAFALLAHYVVAPWLSGEVSPEAGTIERWIGEYETLALGVVAFGGLLGLFWYAFAAWMSRVTHWRGGYLRTAWLILLAAAAAATIVAAFLTPPFQRGAAAVYLSYFVLGTGAFYSATLLFSPVSHKYTPVGAATVRHW